MLPWWLRFQLRRLGIRPPDPEFEHVGPVWQALYRLRATGQRRGRGAQPGR